jgi:HSP20 family protein
MTLVKLNNLHSRNIDPWFNGIFDSIFNDSSTLSSFNSKTSSISRPSVNISEDEKAFEIELVAPGFKKEEFKINLEKALLTISLEKKEEKEEKQYNKREFTFESFSRSFTLPENADGEKISAEYVDGILKVVIAKKEEEKEKVRMISVK